jgi:hypothetical protein
MIIVAQRQLDVFSGTERVRAGRSPRWTGLVGLAQRLSPLSLHAADARHLPGVHQALAQAGGDRLA